jgi:hypothetical protein
MERCLHAPASLFANQPNEVTVDSPEFDSPNGGERNVDESIDSPPPGGMAEDFRVLHLPRLDQCLTEAAQPIFKKTLGKQAARHHVRFGHVTVGQLSVPTVGQDTVGFRLTVPLTIGGVISIPVYADLVFVRDGDSGVELTFTSVGNPFRASMADRLMMLAYQRLDQPNATTA